MQQRVGSPHVEWWRGSLLACALGAALASGGVALAADAPPPASPYAAPQDVASPITDRFYLDAIFFAPDVRTLLRVDPSGMAGAGTPLSGERDLGWPSSNHTGLLELMFKLRERSRLRVDYLQLDRSGSVTLDRTVVIGNETFPCATAPCNLQSTLDWKTMSFTYTYAFLQTEHFELGAGLGVHLLQADLMANAPALLEQHETSVSSAFPTGALDGIWSISRRFAFTFRAQYLGGTVQGFTGSLGDYHGDFQYRWRRNLAIGVGDSYFRANFESEGHHTPGLVRLAIQGPEAFVRVSF
ncbi:MAG TPA: hypothetical protein VME21_17465 [Steroidobacteraceae bacterium]|nr:hypothetical protein [Steroidobacteraceae bacterium]